MAVELDKIFIPGPQELLDLGFFFEKKYVTTSKAGEDLSREVYRYRHPKSEIIFKISVSPLLNSFSASIIKSEKEHFALYSFLKDKGLKGWEYFLAPKSSFDDALSGFLEVLRFSLKTELKDFLLGKKWEEIEFDWFGLK